MQNLGRLSIVEAGRLSKKKVTLRAFRFYRPAPFVAASILARFGTSRLTVWSLTHLRLAARRVATYDCDGRARQTLGPAAPGGRGARGYSTFSKIGRAHV